MPPNRPKKTNCYFNRDDHYLRTLEKTLRGIVVQPPIELTDKLSLDQVAECITASAKMTPTELQLARLPQGRFLVILPPTLDRNEVVAAIPRRVWDEGYKFSSYSPLSDASISITLFKLWIDITGVPVELQRESHMAQAVSSFGLYLGSIEPRIHGDSYTWSIFLATDDLAQVPHEIDLQVGGMAYSALIQPRRWIKSQVFHRSDLPLSSIPFLPPPSPLDTLTTKLTNGPNPDPEKFDADDIVPISLTALREVFKEVPRSTLPQNLAACLAGNKETIEENHAAYWKREIAIAGERRRTNRPPTQTATPCSATPCFATQNPSHLSITPIESQNPRREPTTVPLQPPARASHQTLVAVSDSLSTVHRTSGHDTREIGSQPDLALQVCPNTIAQRNGEGVSTNQALHHLFPEINSAPPPFEATALTPDMTNKRKAPRMTLGPNPDPPRRTTRNTSNNSTNNEAALIDLDVHDFVDIPLQLAEGRELLALIGAGSVPIPAELLAPTLPQPACKEMGRPSKAKHKRKKPTSPTAQEVPTQPNPKSTKQAASDPCPSSDPSAGPPLYKSKPQQPTTSSQAQRQQPLVQKAAPSQLLLCLYEPPQNNCSDQNDDAYLDRVVHSGEGGRI